MKAGNKNMWRRAAAILLAVLLTVSLISCTEGSAALTGKQDGGNTVATKEENGKNMRLGAYVWYGYAHMAWGLYTERYMEDFVDRLEPEWGYGYFEVEDMEYQIDLAVDSGLSFFAIEYWWNQKSGLNEYLALDNYLKAKNRNKLDFCLLVANDGKDSVTSGNWKQVSEKFIYYMTQDGYLTVDGKPVIQFFAPDTLISDMGGVENTKKSFDGLREEMKSRGYPDVLFVACDQTGGGQNFAYLDAGESFSIPTFQKRVNSYTEAGFDAVCGSLTYRFFASQNADEHTLEKDFQELLDTHEKSWEVFTKNTDVQFAPSLTAGWDDRIKWHQFSPVSYYYTKGKTSDKFYNHVINAYEWIDKHPDNALGNLAFLYSWDETDEGSQIIPTRGEGDIMFDAMKRAIRDINSRNK